MLLERGHFKGSTIQKSFINESIKNVRNFSASTSYSTKPTVFLSHKHKDLEDLKELEGVVEMLRELGTELYIDSMDNKMPEETSGVTANRIKEVIKYCDKFILLATKKAIESYWCNWELGVGDTHKFKRHLAILPIKEKGEYDFQYKGNEYLQIYSHVYYENGNNSYRNNGGLIPAGYYVSEPENENGIRYITLLEKWIRNK